MTARWTEEQLETAFERRRRTRDPHHTHALDGCDPVQGGLDIVTAAPGGQVYCRIVGNAPPQPRPRASIVPTGTWPELAARARKARKMADLLALFRAKIVSAYRQHPTYDWKKTARQQINTARNVAGFNEPIVGKGLPLEVLILVVGELAKTHHRKTITVPRKWQVSQNAGDADNVAKPVLDAANGVLWFDDCQIARLNVEQIVGAQGEEPRLEILARPLVELPERTHFEEVAGALSLG